tara:strand:- start:1971 stop:2237 length:267 start_codon:yes stop_codon:yes gene_type:complete
MNIGDKVICVRNTFTDKEWDNADLCAVSIPFNIGDVFIISSLNGSKKGLVFEPSILNIYYPKVGFELYNNIPDNLDSLITIFDELNIK